MPKRKPVPWYRQTVYPYMVGIPAWVLVILMGLAILGAIFNPGGLR